MVTMLLLCVIYIAFIGMGLPSSLFGAPFPAIQTDFTLSAASANYVTVLISGFTVVAVMLGARVVNKFGTFKVISACTLLAAIAFIGFSISPNLWVVCLFAIPLGISAGATDAAFNNYMSLHYEAIHLNLMHCLYGIGTVASPFIMAIVLKNGSWRGGYRVVFLMQIVIVFIVIMSLPLWKKVKHTIRTADDVPVKSENLSYLSMVKNPVIRLA